MEDHQLVSILFFKGTHCAPCKIVEKHLMSMVNSSKGSNAAKLTVINTDIEQELVDKYKVTNVPEVWFNEHKVLTAQQASELLGSGGGLDAMMSGVPVEEDNSPMAMFSGGQQAIFNHLFSAMIQESIRADESRRADWGKYAMILLSEQDLLHPTELVRESIGDYVHIGVLQSIILSILSLSPDSGEYIYQAGRTMGRIGTPQMRFLQNNQKLLDLAYIEDERKRLQIVLKCLEKHFHQMSYGLPLYMSARAKSRIQNKRQAILRILDSAFAAGIANIGIPVCYMVAGEISGLIETTLGTAVEVVETKCFGMGHRFCEFQITLLDEESKLAASSQLKKSADFSEERKTRFREAMTQISDKMYKSSLIRSRIRECGDYVHISVLQHALVGIKFADPFYGTLLFYAGQYHGKTGSDFVIVERIAKRKGLDLVKGIEFEEACKLLAAYFNDPSTILTRMYGEVSCEIVDDDEALFKVYECAMASHLAIQEESQTLFAVGDEKVYLCEYTMGFIAGRLERMIHEEISCKEVKCHSLGDDHCEYKVTI